MPALCGCAAKTSISPAFHAGTIRVSRLSKSRNFRRAACAASFTSSTEKLNQYKTKKGGFNVRNNAVSASRLRVCGRRTRRSPEYS